jgi:glutamate/tyrosine decarboxylase-like PLP-dependent enzyme
MEENDLIRTGFLGDQPHQSLDCLKSAIDEQVMPFLAEWWEPKSPIPTEQEIQKLHNAIAERMAQNPQLPQAYRDLPDLLKRLSEGIRFNRRNFVNIHPSPFVPAALASFIVALQNPNNIVEEVSRATTSMERESVEWIAKNLCGIDNPREMGSWGTIVSGGTVANLTALLVARDYTYDKLSRPRPGRVGPRGVIGLKPGVVIGTAATHYSIEKALWFLGLGHENLIRTPVCWDESLKGLNYKEHRFIKGIQLDPWKKNLVEAIDLDRKLGEEELSTFYDGGHSPFGLQPLNSEILKTLYSCFEFDIPLIACVLSLGTTDTGTIERMHGIAIDELRKEDIFIHIDAASGGFAVASNQVKAKFDNLPQMDSFTVDAHKMGFLHYPCGAVIFKDRGFKEQIYHEAPYLGELAPTLEGSRSGGSSAALWLALKTIGIDGYEIIVNRLLNFTEELAALLAKSGKYQVLHKLDLNAVAVAPLPENGESRRQVNKLVRAVRQRFLAPGAEFLINIDHRLAGIKVKNMPGHKESEPIDIESLRIVVTNPLVKSEDAQKLVDIMVQYLEDERKVSHSIGHDIV